MAIVINEHCAVLVVPPVDNGAVTVTSVSVPTVVAVTTSGPQGITGPSGPQGLTGGGTVYTQTTPASTWVINHNTGRSVSATVYVDGQSVITDVIANNPNTLTIVFATPQIGEVVYS